MICPEHPETNLQLERDTAIKIMRELRDAIWDKAEPVEFLVEGTVSIVRTISISQQFNAANSFLRSLDDKSNREIKGDNGQQTTAGVLEG
jgi:hypothetical protein